MPPLTHKDIMGLKAIVFVILCLGIVGGVGLLAHSFPGLANPAFTAGGFTPAYGTCMLIFGAVFSLWIAAKIK